MSKGSVLPFGFWFAERFEDRVIPPAREWDWTPNDEHAFFAAEASLPGTTGTGADARSDETRDES